MIDQAFDCDKVLYLRDALADRFTMAPQWAQTAAIGLLERLWKYTRTNHPTGAIGRATDAIIAEKVGWPGEPAELMEMLLRLRWVDAHPVHRYVIHDWAQHAPDFLHATLARRAERFADGTIPRMTKLSRDERKEAAARYGATEPPTAPDGVTEPPTAPDGVTEPPTAPNQYQYLNQPIPLPTNTTTNPTGPGGPAESWLADFVNDLSEGDETPEEFGAALQEAVDQFLDNREAFRESHALDWEQPEQSSFLKALSDVAQRIADTVDLGTETRNKALRIVLTRFLAWITQEDTRRYSPPSRGRPEGFCWLLPYHDLETLAAAPADKWATMWSQFWSATRSACPWIDRDYPIREVM